MSTNKTIIFIELKNFYLIGAQGLARPNGDTSLAVSREGKVLEASKQALTSGVTPGLSVKLAKRRCPSLQLVDFDPDSYHVLYHRAWSYFANLTPQVEPIDLHAGYLDLTGCFPRTVTPTKYVVTHLQRLHDTTGLEFEWGGGENRWMAWMARETGWFVPKDKEQDFLARVPIQKLQISSELVARLLRYGTQTVAQYLALPPSFLISHLQLSKEECDAARRRDTSDIQCLYPPAKISVVEDFSWGFDSEYPEVIERACGSAYQELVNGSYRTGQVTVKLVSKTETTFDTVKPSKPLHTRPQLHRVITGFVLERKVKQPKKLEVILDLLVPDFRLQLNLWQSTTQTERETNNLETARMRLSAKYGHSLLLDGSEYSIQHPPRFAQLIYGLQGRHLP